MIRRDHPAYGALVELQDNARKAPAAAKLALMPPESFHMTVFDLHCLERNDPAHWSSKLPHGVSLRDADSFFCEAVSSVAGPDGIRMKCMGLGTDRFFCLLLEPLDAGQAARLGAYRDALSEATGIRFPDHERYQFHVTLAYHLRYLTDQEKAWMRSTLRLDLPDITLPSPEIVFFDDMYRFVPAPERNQLKTRIDRIGNRSEKTKEEA